MIKWKHVKKGAENNIAELYRTEKGCHLIEVSKVGDNVFTVRWFRGAILTIQETYIAENWFYARAMALRKIEEYIEEKAYYWRDIKSFFANWEE